MVLDHILWRDPERVLTPRRLSTVRTGSDHRGLVLTYDLKPAKRATTPPPKPPPVVTPPTPEPETPKPPEEEPVNRLPDNLPAILRAEGLKVEEVDDWRSRGRPASSGGFAPVGVLCHHTATGKSSSKSAVLNLLVRGRSDLPGPLCQLGLDRDGTVYIVAAGRANHAGKAKASGTVAAGDGNRLYIGIEAFNDGRGEKWPAVQYDAYVTLAAALCKHITGNSAQTVRGHKETSVTGKIDPTFDMGDFRERVAERLADKAEPPATPKPDPGPVTTNKDTLIGKARLLLDEARDNAVRDKNPKREGRIEAALDVLPKE